MIVYKCIGVFPSLMALDLKKASKKTGQQIQLGPKRWDEKPISYITVCSPETDLSKTWNVYRHETSRWVVVNSKENKFLQSINFEGSSRNLVPTWTEDMSQACVITQAKADEYMDKLRGLDMFVVTYPLGARELVDVLGEE